MKLYEFVVLENFKNTKYKMNSYFIFVHSYVCNIEKSLNSK